MVDILEFKIRDIQFVKDEDGPYYIAEFAGLMTWIRLDVVNMDNIGNLYSWGVCPLVIEDNYTPMERELPLEDVRRSVHGWFLNVIKAMGGDIKVTLEEARLDRDELTDMLSLSSGVVQIDLFQSTVTSKYALLIICSDVTDTIRDIVSAGGYRGTDVIFRNGKWQSELKTFKIVEYGHVR